MSAPQSSGKDAALRGPDDGAGCPQNLMSAPIGFFVSIPAGRYVSVNSALAVMLGYASPEELIASITDIASQVYVDPRERKNSQTCWRHKARWPISNAASGTAAAPSYGLR
jgi:hypothetical protein